jgi:hypothetical protein
MGSPSAAGRNGHGCISSDSPQAILPLPCLFSLDRTDDERKYHKKKEPNKWSGYNPVYFCFIFHKFMV